MSVQHQVNSIAANCSSCDAQCCRLTAVLGASEQVPAHLTIEMPGGLRAMAKGEDGWCVALDRVRMNCGIYDDRPLVCRRFKMGGPYCRAIFSGGDDVPAATPR
ncbi:YkgJ family cysteine cluster protein [Bacillus subtilis subsp. subtilis]|nr:YkgJ family cysteine cluster protein [Bacillus subtilis subsp. subtilis]